MTPCRGLYVGLAGLVITVLGMGTLCLADASGQSKPSAERTLAGLGGGFGLIVMVVGLIVHGHFAARVFAIIVGAFVAFWVGATIGFLVTKGSEEVPAAFGFLAAIAWLILASVLWAKTRKSTVKRTAVTNGDIQ